ncbi:MAG: catechol 1,2-dioxygenase [Saprospiraceae bacterium]|nr:catechol 1,2-dioxygenase [Saprospiraceae bacterium]
MQRRAFIKNSSLTVISISAFGSLNWNGHIFEGDTPTTTDILGPFYRPGAPLRSNLRLENSKGTPIVLKGIIFKEDGKTPVKNALVEVWHCDEHEVYDNTSDEFKYRGGQKTNSNGKYEFKSILPVPYKANPNDESSWRPAHIHMRVSVPNQQDLITQLYFKGGKYVNTDKWASAPQAVNRLLDVTENSSGVKEIVFNVIMSKEIPLEKEAYNKLTGLYQMDDNSKVEFIRKDDLLFMKRNGQLTAGLKYMGNNTFEGGIGFPKVSFELLTNGGTKAVVTTPTQSYVGEKFLKYSD